jgi:beta-N-acetylhexosaminidase
MGNGSRRLLVMSLFGIVLTGLVAVGLREESRGSKSRGGGPHGGQLNSLGERRHRQAEVADRGSPQIGPVELARDLGELIIARYVGLRPSRALIERIRRGEIGGVILFNDNTAGGDAQTRKAIATMQQAARDSGSYPLLIMTDQEGGTVKRIADIPPALAPSAMGSSLRAHREGWTAGRALSAIGVNVDLAPVADVEQAGGSFLGTRAFASTAATVERLACAFAAGLSDAGVAYTLKHFPGLGLAEGNTDDGPVEVSAPGSALRRSYGAYRRCARSPLSLVMISSAGYPNLTGSTTPAVLSPEIYRHELAVAGVVAPTISDDLDAPAISTLRAPARRALNAGLDLLLFAKTECSSIRAYATLRSDLTAGSLHRRSVIRAAQAVARLKQALLTDVKQKENR